MRSLHTEQKKYEEQITGQRSEICSAALRTYGAGWVHISSSLCDVVNLKTTYGRNDIKSALRD
ncbi:hypothetical protein CTI12_AA508960 [Artemisia annua]|uniref:Uncharacterized protein n=1 Tax=Artemisia annua TaxID=35608 RepID=A0A2U1LBS2_ARTAN|nr:hypothetical protein CTI12_AA508960 [Artemisia annua]